MHLYLIATENGGHLVQFDSPVMTYSVTSTLNIIPAVAISFSFLLSTRF